MSLLQGVLKAKIEDIEGRLYNGRINRTRSSSEDSDDDLVVNVVSLPTSPTRTRPPSPVRGASSRPINKGPLILSSNRRDPLKAFPTELSQKIFLRLSIKDLANCALVSKKWNRSQTLNYVWFRHYRKENFHDDSLPPGKWTKRESKQNWRVVYQRDRSSPPTSYSRLSSGYTTPSRGMSGYQTPREIKEEQWRAEAETIKPGKVEMREMYKELGGRKAKSKVKVGSSGIRDRGGWAASDDWDI